eukprot:TRINITY_DN13855_c0_g2_i1.p1 TRINITY_DN13855_c0_g2~~TRINITY_DN13855_c0_g2_i1.p1  ORF type:complete len:242 (-),score=69.61 TRINITY_DN13855_c0_g2_i1:142-792(-)
MDPALAEAAQVLASSGTSEAPRADSAGLAATQQQQQQQQHFRQRIDAAVSTLMEGYASIIEAAKAGTRCEMAVNAYAASANTAAMARAADELVRIAGELSSARIANDVKARTEELAAERDALERQIDEASTGVAQVFDKSTSASAAGWLLARPGEEPDRVPFTEIPSAAKLADARRRGFSANDGTEQPKRQRLQPHWTVETFRQGGTIQQSGTGPL